MTSTSNNTFLNPDTYLNHLSPTEGRNFEFGRNVGLVVLGATLWDILVYIPDDLRIVRRSLMRFTSFAFLFSRLFAAAYMFCFVIASTMPTKQPKTLSRASSCFCSLSISLSAFLFLRRVCAVYTDKKAVQWFFSAVWMVHVGSSVAIPIGVTPTFIPGTHYFEASVIRPLIFLSSLSSLFFDTCVFLAISYRVASSRGSPDEPIRWATLLSGKALPRLSRSILQEGQQYYLVTVLSTVMASTTLFTSTPPPVKFIFSIPVVPLVASMASRVFRNTKLFNDNNTEARSITDLEFTAGISHTLPESTLVPPVATTSSRD